jgi:HAD superfamily hydrolase (TIGR01549 family)
MDTLQPRAAALVTRSTTSIVDVSEPGARKTGCKDGPVRHLEAVVFDLGETLVDETRQWSEWADWLGVSTFTLFAAMGAAIGDRRHHLDAFEAIRPDFDLAAERAEREAAGRPWRLGSEDLYPDAVPSLDALSEAGFRIGIVGNQPAAVESMLPEIHSRADVVGSSGSWGVEKPDPAFFERVIAEMGCPAAVIAYVGDRLDNDVLPAIAAGMTGIHLRRGPWGVIQAGWPEAAAATASVADLRELVGIVSICRQ